jgi:cell division protein FtsL
VAGLDPVVHPDLGNRKGIGVSAFLLALVTAGAMAHVGVRMKGIEVAYDLGHERRINTQLEEERRRLNIEIGMLKDPVRVVSIARDKLKMGPPAQTDIVRLAPGLVLGAAPVSAPTSADRPKRAEHAVASRKHPAAPAPASPSAKASASAAESAADDQGAPMREGDE